MERILIELESTIDEKVLNTFRHALKRAIEACEIPESIVDKATLSFTEIASNSVKHSETSRIQLLASVDGATLNMRIKDNGILFPENILENSDLPPPGFGNSPENSRGMAIVSDSSDPISVDHISEGIWKNCFSLTWQLPAKETRDKILLVDDDPALLLLYSQYLAEDYLVTVANNGIEALKKIQSERIDVVVSDINMPEMNGIEFRESLYRTQGKSLIPFIFLSMDENRETLDKAIRSGVDDYLKKPVNKQQLRTTITRVCKRVRSLALELGKRINLEISSALCPTLPNQINGWRIATSSRNTGSGGGDLIVYHQTGSSTHIAIVDVMGHDDAAKFFSYAYAGYLKGLMLGLGEDISPQFILNQLSDKIYQDTLLSQLNLTCCIVELKPSGQLSLSSAGHPAPLLIENTKAFPINSGGMMPGLIPEQQYKMESLTLTASQRIAFYTDGLFDAVDSDAARTRLESRILAEIAASTSVPIEESVNGIFNYFDSETKNHPTDDALLILMEPKV